MNIIGYLLTQFLKEEWINVSLLLIISLLTNALQTSGISYISANIINFTQQHEELKAWSYFKYFVLVTFLYILLFFTYRLFKDNMMTKLTQWLQFSLVKMILTINNHTLSNSNFTNMNALINQLTNTCFTFFSDVISYLIPNLAFLVVIVLYFCYENLNFSGLFLLGNFVSIAFLVWNWDGLMEKNLHYESLAVQGEARLVEILNNLDKIVYRAQSKIESNMYREKQGEIVDAAMEYYLSANSNMFVMNTLIFATTCCSTAYLLVLITQRKISITTFITIFTMLSLYRERATSSFMQIFDVMDFIGHSQNIVNQFESMSEHYQTVVDIELSKPDLPLHDIEFRNVSFKYESSDALLFDHVQFHLETHGNQILGITGLSGKGKSTFMKLLVKLYKCTEGDILIDGQPIKDIDNDYLRSKIVYIDQNSKLFDRTVLQNFLYGCNQETELCTQRLEEILTCPKIKQLYTGIE